MRDSWSQCAEADGVLGFGADDRVTECLGGHDDATALVIGQIDRRVVGHGLRDGLTTLSADSSVLKFTGRATF